MTVSKGLIIAPFISMVYCIIYAIISILQRYYGEAIICIVLMLPVCILTAISWLKNRSKENQNTVKINKIHGQEYLYLFIGAIFITVAFYFILKALNTSELIISTISLITFVIASYLEFRRVVIMRSVM